MATARVIRTGKTQIVELPEDVRLKGELVDIIQRDNEIVLRDAASPLPGRETDWKRLFDCLADLAELIGDVPEDPPPEDRPGL